MMSEEEVEKVVNAIGIKEKRVADKGVCASDLCFKAAEKLLEDNQTDKGEVDALIFVSQTPDYRQPATAMSLQSRLGLSKSTLCFDVNLACSFRAEHGLARLDSLGSLYQFYWKVFFHL